MTTLGRTILALASTVLLVACSSREQFIKAASPLATNFSADINASPVTSGVLKQHASELAAAAAAGDKATVVAAWYGENAVRDGYVTYLSSDPRFATADGEALREIKRRKVNQFDYVLSIGTTPPPSR